MKASSEVKIDLLKALIMEDRKEIRDIRAAIYKVTVLISTASFAATSFLLGRPFPHVKTIGSVTDVLSVLILWVFFLRLKRDLFCGRQCLVARQRLLNSLGTADEPEDLNPFPDARNCAPDVTDSELWVLPILATFAIGAKAVVAVIIA